MTILGTGATGTVGRSRRADFPAWRRYARARARGPSKAGLPDGLATAKRDRLAADALRAISLLSNRACGGS